MKADSPRQPAKLEAIEEQVVAMLVSIGLPAAEAAHRINLWRARQHDLEGQALEAILPGLTPDQQDQAVLRWALEGQQLEDNLRAGACALGLDLPD
ncbi:MAG: hypothetical protein KF760_17815 [Candidatus Eremiobacteraeota bacterium]|nr:hypothetical protein [Candidatus Eremiobacteraeota bacterium]MCW5869238.1 hypothetical protein [Candidatus Eremiobacteraeota bacterium]